MNNKLSKFGKIAIKYISEVNSDLTSTTATIKGPLTNQMHLIFPINNSYAYLVNVALGDVRPPKFPNSTTFH
jgi:hypothetical protein